MKEKAQFKVEIILNGKSINIEEMAEEYENMKSGLYLANLLKEKLMGLGKVMYAEFPWIDHYAPTHMNRGLRYAISVFNEISDKSETLVYYAGCGCCSMETWKDEIIASSAKKVVLVRDHTTQDFHKKYFDTIRNAGISLIDISIQEMQEEVKVNM